MWRIFKRILQASLALLVLGTLATVWLMARGGAFKTIEDSFAGGECSALPLTGSAEDIQPDRERNVVYLSLLDRRGLVRGEAPQGDILRVDLSEPELRAVTALRDRPAHFRPHGLSLHIDADGNRHLFVINHPADRASEPELVELFREVAPGEFTHVRTFSDPLMISPNDIVAVGPGQFYVANDKVSGGVLAAALQQFGVGGSPLVYVDGERAEVVSGNIAAGGGISASNDLRQVYVAETSAQRLRVFERTGSGGTVRELARIPLGTSPDNIDVAPDGSLWIGAHANVFALIQHFTAEKPAPSQVLRVALRDGTQADIEQVYLNTGEAISASSVGVQIDGRLLIGSITERKMLVCKL
jgi:arylesterase/paraoxonase